MRYMNGRSINGEHEGKENRVTQVDTFELNLINFTRIYQGESPFESPIPGHRRIYTTDNHHRELLNAIIILFLGDLKSSWWGGIRFFPDQCILSNYVIHTECTLKEACFGWLTVVLSRYQKKSGTSWLTHHWFSPLRFLRPSPSTRILSFSSPPTPLFPLPPPSPVF